MRNAAATCSDSSLTRHIVLTCAHHLFAWFLESAVFCSGFVAAVLVLTGCIHM